VIFVHYGVLQFAYCAVVIAEDFDVVEVCCKTFYLIVFHSVHFLCYIFSVKILLGVTPLISVPLSGSVQWYLASVSYPNK